MCLQFTLSSYFQCRLLSVTSPVTEWLSSAPISGVSLHNPSFVAQLVSAWPSVREVPSSIPGNTTSFSFNFSPLHTCQLSRIIWESPEYGIDLPLSRTGPGGGGTPIHYLYGYVPPNGVVILKLLI